MQRDMAVIGLPSETSLGKVEPGFVVSWKKVSNASTVSTDELLCLKNVGFQIIIFFHLK
jgi:hypothetical protein